MVPTYVERFWNPRDESGLSRRDRTPGKYNAYVPDELGVALPQLSATAQQAAENALTALARADERVGARVGYLSHLLIRSESISSSWIEGNRVTPKRLAIAEIAHTGNRVARDVIANVRATEDAIERLGDSTRLITVDDIVQLQHVIEPRLEAGIRQEQNWVGGGGWSPLRADFVPPPEDEVPRLLKDLAGFISATEGNALVRAAIAHAQFETIHPFPDGNGRTGRALIHSVLRRSDAVRHILIPISTVFSGNADRYIAGLTAFRAQPSKVEEWVLAFVEAAEIAAANAVVLADEVDAVGEELSTLLINYRRAEALSPVAPRRDSVLLKILDTLPTRPVLTAEAVVDQFDVSSAAAYRALNALADAGVLGRSKDQKGRVVCWTADRYLDLVSVTERRNRVGDADTRERKPRLGPPRPPG